MSNLILSLLIIFIYYAVKDLLKKDRQIKYLNFKINVLSRLVLSEEFKQIDMLDTDFHSAEDPALMKVISERRNQKLDEIKSKFNVAIDDELLNRDEEAYKEALRFIRFHTLERAYPFYQIYSVDDILKRHKSIKEAEKKP